MKIDLEAVRTTAREVRAAFLEMPEEPYRGAKKEENPEECGGKCISRV